MYTSGNLELLANEHGTCSLFCVHTVTGQVSCYRSLANAMVPSVQVLGIRASDLKTARSQSTSVQRLAQEYLSEIERIDPPRPYHFLGWSTGGFIAWEMARSYRSLHPASSAMTKLFLIESRLFMQPQAPNRRIFYLPQEQRFWVVFTSVLLSWEDRAMLSPTHPFWTLSDFDKISNIIERLKHGDSKSRFWVTQSRSSIERYLRFFEMQWDAMCIDFWPNLYAGDVVYVTPTETDTPEACDDWRPFVSGKLAVVGVAGTHSSVLHIPNVSILAAELMRHIA